MSPSRVQRDRGPRREWRARIPVNPACCHNRRCLQSSLRSQCADSDCPRLRAHRSRCQLAMSRPGHGDYGIDACLAWGRAHLVVRLRVRRRGPCGNGDHARFGFRYAGTARSGTGSARQIGLEIRGAAPKRDCDVTHAYTRDHEKVDPHWGVRIRLTLTRPIGRDCGNIAQTVVRNIYGEAA